MVFINRYVDSLNVQFVVNFVRALFLFSSVATNNLSLNQSEKHDPNENDFRLDSSHSCVAVVLYTHTHMWYVRTYMCRYACMRYVCCLRAAAWMVDGRPTRYYIHKTTLLLWHGDAWMGMK